MLRKINHHLRRAMTLVVALLMGISLLATACGGTEPEPEKTQSGASQPGTVVTEKNEADRDDETYVVRVGQTGRGIKPAMIVLAHQLGYFDAEGVDLEWVQIQNLYDGITALDTDKMDVLPMGIIPSVSAIAQGTDLVVFGGTIAEGSQAVTKPENKDQYQDLNALAGKTIACMRPETGHLFIRHAVNDMGLEAEWVELDGFQPCIEAVKKGEADIAFVNSGFAFQAEQQGLVLAFNVAEYFPRNVCCRQTASRKALKENREGLVRLQIANLRAYEFAYGEQAETNHETVLDEIVDYSGLERDYVDYCLYGGAMSYELDPATDKVKEFYDLMRDMGALDIKEGVDIQQHLDNAIYRDALERLTERYPDNTTYRSLLDNIGRDNHADYDGTGH